MEEKEKEKDDFSMIIGEKTYTDRKEAGTKRKGKREDRFFQKIEKWPGKDEKILCIRDGFPV